MHSSQGPMPTLMCALQDPLGLRQMDHEGKLVFEAYEDSHCHFSVRIRLQAFD